METHTSHQLLELAIAQAENAQPEFGFNTALKALDLASAQGDEHQRRRSLNILSHCCCISGHYVDAIDYGLQAASLARTLGQVDAMINALGNVTAALGDIEFHEETVEIAKRVITKYGDHVDSQSDLQIVLTNAANACLNVSMYVEALHYSQLAIDRYPVFDSHETARIRLANELNIVSASAMLDQTSSLETRITDMREIVNSYPSVRNNHLLVQANAINLHYSHARTQEAIASLVRLLSIANGDGTVMLDCLRWLEKLSQLSGDKRHASTYQQAIQDHLTAHQSSRIKRAMLAIDTINPAPAPVQRISAHEWINRLIEDPSPTAPHPERTEARLSRDKQNALERIAVSVRIKDDLTGLSIYRIGKLAAWLAESLGYTLLEARALEWATRLYPIGEAALRASDTQHPALKLAANIAQCCHERWDGYGSPRQLCGIEIPEPARIAAIAICYDELTHQCTRGHSEAVQIILDEAGNQLDPALVAAFLPMIERHHERHQTGLDTPLAAGAPERRRAKTAQVNLKDLVPGLTLLEV